MSYLQQYVKNALHKQFAELDFIENYRPEWLLSESGTKLELDFYCEEIGVAVEVQGKQHYKYVDVFHRDFSGFMKQLKRDEIKRQTCLDRKIYLIEIYNKSHVDSLIELIAFKTMKRSLYSNPRRRTRYLKRKKRERNGAFLIFVQYLNGGIKIYRAFRPNDIKSLVGNYYENIIMAKMMFTKTPQGHQRLIENMISEGYLSFVLEWFDPKPIECKWGGPEI